MSGSPRKARSLARAHSGLRRRLAGAALALIVALNLVSLAAAQDDTSMLSIDQLHIFLMPVGDRVLISEYYLVSNSGAEAYTGDPDSGVTLAISLPEGAANVQFDEEAEDAANYGILEGEDGSAAAVVDTAPILPGSATSEVRFSYELPLVAGITVRREVPLATSSTVILVTGDQWELEGEQLLAFGEIDAGGGTALAYTVDPMLAGDSFTFAFMPAAGAPASSDMAATSASRAPSEGLGIGLGALSLVLVAVGIFAVWRRGTTPRLPRDLRTEILLLAALDREFEAGALDRDTYEERRRAAKSQIRDRLQKSVHG